MFASTGSHWEGHGKIKSKAWLEIVGGGGAGRRVLGMLGIQH